MLVISALIDRVGRRPSLISGLAIMAVSTVMLAWVESIAWTSLSPFLLALPMLALRSPMYDTYTCMRQQDWDR